MQIAWSGIGITDGRGSLGTNQLSKNRSGNICSLKTIPRQPQTTKQQLQKSQYSQVTQYWKGLTEAERILWDAAAELPQNTKTNSVGVSYQPTGFSLFTSCNLNSFLTSYPITEPVTYPTWTGLSMTDAEYVDKDTLNLTFSTGTIDADEEVVMFATAAVSPGSMNPYQPNYRFIGRIDSGSLATTFNIASTYILTFDPVPIQSKVYFSAYLNLISGGYRQRIGIASAIRLE